MTGVLATPWRPLWNAWVYAIDTFLYVPRLCVQKGSRRQMSRSCTARWGLSSFPSFSRVRLFATPRTAAHQACHHQLDVKLMSIEPVMPSNHLILWHPFLLLPSVFPSIRVFSNQSLLHIRWPKYWSFNFSISPSNEYSGLILGGA